MMTSDWLCVNCGEPADPDLFDYCEKCDIKLGDLYYRREADELNKNLP